MKKWIPMEKRSKKEQKAYYSAQRGSWNGVIPVTKLIPNKKAYNRKKKLRGEDIPNAVFSFVSVAFLC